METQKPYLRLADLERPGLTEAKIIKLIAEKVKKAKRILIAGHIGPDFDAVGSSLAFYFLLKDLKKECFLATSFAGNIWKFFREDLPLKSGIKKAKKIDLAILLDYGNRDRLRKALEIIEKNKPEVISIDHHNFQTQFGEIVWVDTGYSSVCEMLYQLFKKANWDIPDIVAYYLLLGIVGDTGGFSYYPLSQKRLKVLRDLIRTGEEFPYFLNLSKIWQKSDDLKKFGKYLSRISVDKDLKVGFCVLSYEQETAYICNRLVAEISLVKGIEISLILLKNYNGDLVKGELRGSKENKLNLAEIASIFGGGGHFNAAGFISELSSAKIIKVIREEIKKTQNSNVKT
jgi:phosphoesterase RecJ-like protein